MENVDPNVGLATRADYDELVSTLRASSPIFLGLRHEHERHGDPALG